MATPSASVTASTVEPPIVKVTGCPASAAPPAVSVALTGIVEP